jgi:hypothetical protein
LWATEFTRSNTNNEFSKNSEVEDCKSNNKFESIVVAGAPTRCSWGANKLLLLFLL